MRKSFLTLLVFFLFTSNVEAVCTNKEKLDVGAKAANIKHNYEIVENTEQAEDGVSTDEYFKITILNIVKEIYVEVSNDVNNQTRTYTYNDTDNGIITFNWEENEVKTNFTIKVYASDYSNCKGDLLKTIKFTTPHYNDFYNRAICAEMTDFYLCQKYISTDNVDESMFISKIDSFKKGEINNEGEEQPNKKEEKGFFAKYKWYIIGTLGVVIVVATTLTIVDIKKQREQSL